MYLVFYEKKTNPTMEQNKIGSITYYISESINEITKEKNIQMTISNVHICPKKRDQGLAYFLILFAYYDLFYQMPYFETREPFIIELDDMSDHFQKVHNLYKNIGFEYVQKGYPEMKMEMHSRKFQPFFRSILHKIKMKKRWNIEHILMNPESIDEERIGNKDEIFIQSWINKRFETFKKYF